MSVEFYRVYVVCKHCSQTYERMIPKGQTVEQTRCHICGYKLSPATWATYLTKPQEEL